MRFQLVKSSVCGDELARIVIEVLHRTLGVLQGPLLAATTDRAAVNTCALKTVLYTDMLDVCCIGENRHVVTVFCTPRIRWKIECQRYLAYKMCMRFLFLKGEMRFH